MLEIVFSEGAAGGLAAAIRKKRSAKGGAAVFAEGEFKMADPGQSALAESRADICSFPLYLGFGEIDEPGIGPLRERAVAALMGTYPKEGEAAASQMLKTARASLDKLLARAKQGEALRIWTSGTPDDACGLCWLMEQLAPILSEKLEIALVLLPAFCQEPDGTAVLYSGWAECPAQEWIRMAELGQKLPLALCRAMAACWQQLRAQKVIICHNHKNGVSEASVEDRFLTEYLSRTLSAADIEFIGHYIVTSSDCVRCPDCTEER